MRLKLISLALAAAFVTPVALAQTSGTTSGQYDARTNKEEPQKPGSGQVNPQDPPAESAGKPNTMSSPDTKRGDTGAAGENAMGGGAAVKRGSADTTNAGPKTKPSDSDRRYGSSPGNANAAGEGTLGGSPDQQARKNHERDRDNTDTTNGTTSGQPGR